MKTLYPKKHLENKGPIEPDLSPPRTSKNTWETIKIKTRQLIEEAEYNIWIEPIKATQKSEYQLILEVPNFVFYQEFVDTYLDKIDLVKNSIGWEPMDIIVQVNGANVDEMAGDRETVETFSFEYKTHPDAISDRTRKKRKPKPDTPQNSLDSKKSNPKQTGASLLSQKPYPSRTLGTEINEHPTNKPEANKPKPGSFSKALDKAPSHIDPQYQFDTFVRGLSNQFAVASCQNVAENPGKNYNPLFIYGLTGLGKTHLMHAVGNNVLNITPDAVVTYVRSENFMNEMIYCIRHDKMWEFRQKYRNCDVLLVDDIQFISGKPATQEEFFHTFNALYESRKQIVITSDMFPRDIPDIQERLRNRFNWGLIADIQPPDSEHRMAILLNKAEQMQINLPKDVAEFISTLSTRNVRELEGALNRISAFATLHGRPIDIQLASETFQHVLGDTPKRLSIETIQKVVAEHFKIRVSDLKSKKRQRAITVPRQIAMYLSRHLTKSSFPEIGNKFGGKDHTTVMHAVKKIIAEQQKDLDLKANIETLERNLEQLH